MKNSRNNATDLHEINSDIDTKGKRIEPKKKISYRLTKREQNGYNKFLQYSLSEQKQILKVVGFELLLYRGICNIPKTLIIKAIGQMVYVRIYIKLWGKESPITKEFYTKYQNLLQGVK